ncbi:hypothetical protein [Maribellus maritimus]|uniref:hypothetical protein n=1 Tax=Maribellus maritimus TaxID=2870838 RepID=UPI001EEA4385|nr:hypothetical protein [Maribellus maritimus]MCG6187072.1 hypothetical protein [Maribellus maritimus]
MKTKLIYLILMTLVICFNATAQLEGKKFSTKVEGIGEINLEFKNNVYELSTSASVIVVKGNYEINKNTINFTDTEGPMACPEDITGKYEFVFNNEDLMLKAIQDACPGRNTMAGTLWKEVTKNRQ